MEDCNWETIFYGHYRSGFNNCDVIGSKAIAAIYDDHLRLIGKRVGDFLLELIELFSLGITAEALRAIIGSKSAISLQRGPVDPNFQVEGVAPPPTILLLRKLG